MATDRIGDIRLLRELLLSEHRTNVGCRGYKLLCVFSLAADAYAKDITFHKQNCRPWAGWYGVSSWLAAHPTHRSFKRSNSRTRGEWPPAAHYALHVSKAMDIQYREVHSETCTTLYVYGDSMPVYGDSIPHMTLVINTTPRCTELFSITYGASSWLVTDKLHTVKWR